MVIIDHLASIVTLIGFPLILFGLFDLYRERRLSMWKARKWVGIALLLLGVAAWSADVADRLGYIKLANWSAFSNTGRIVWNYEETARGHGYFLNMQHPTGQETNIVGFGAHGKNNSSEPVNDFDGYLRSDTTNETLPIYILASDVGATNACTVPVPTLPKDTLGIPAFADFDIVTHKKPFFINVLADGIPLPKFVNQFVPFTIVLKYDGTTYQRRFSKEEVDRQISMLEKLTAPITNPHVVRKQSAPPLIAVPPLTTLVPPSSTPVPPGNHDLTGKIPQK
jgi:hypothetical protein